MSILESTRKMTTNEKMCYDIGYAQGKQDAVPVVRCGECEYYQDNNGGYPHEECRWGHDETPDADDFCSYGKRLEVEHDNTQAET